MKTIRLRKTVFFSLIIFTMSAGLFADDQLFLIRYVPSIRPRTDDLTAKTDSTEYKPVFGHGDRDANKLNGIVRFGELTIQPGGASAVVNYPAEEQMYFILEGNGILHYDSDTFPVKKNDFMYFPVGVAHGISNDSNAPVRLLVMGYRIPEGTEVPPTPNLFLANSEDVELQVLGGHGPTTQFKLLMGTTRSTRDKLAAASQMNSMFIMDFAPHGTNIPHRHAKEEEIYYVLRGAGSMVAGLDSHGNEMRHPCQEGDSFYFAAGTEVGFYSGVKEGDEHALILALRSIDPGQNK